MRHLVITSLASLALAGCTTQPPAPVDDYGSQYYGREYYPASYVVDGNNTQPPAEVVTNQPEYNTSQSSSAYIVAAGDTLYAIARAQNSTIPAIAAANNLSAPYLLSPGQRLTIPGGTYNATQAIEVATDETATEEPRSTTASATNADSNDSYNVEKGDTLYGIARAHNTSVAAIAAENNIAAPYNLTPGQTLLLPQGISAASYNAAKPAAGTTSSAVAATSSAKTASYTSLSAPSSFSWPVSGKVISTFGDGSGSYRNDGINISAASGTSVKAAAPGQVVYAGNGLKGYGNMIIIRHGGDWLTSYAHQKEFLVNKGETVKNGQVIGTVGDTGNVDRPQLHFSIRKGTSAKDPKKYLK